MKKCTYMLMYVQVSDEAEKIAWNDKNGMIRRKSFLVITVKIECGIVLKSTIAIEKHPMKKCTEYTKIRQDKKTD